MKITGKLRIAVDAAMTALLLNLMGYHLWGEAVHEWLGAGIFVLFLLHHGLNVKWYGALFKGKYSPQRIFQTVLDFFLCLDMLALIISGVMMSRHVFAFLGLNGGMALARQMHLAGSYWGFVLMSLHLGLHWNMIMGMARKVARRKMPSPLGVVVSGIAAYGLWAFIRRDFPIYLLLQTHFVFFDFSEPALLFILDYLAIIGLFAAASYYLGKVRFCAAPAGKQKPWKVMINETANHAADYAFHCAYFLPSPAVSGKRECTNRRKMLPP